ncbi:hypothetical protein [Mycobacteroides abscessus]
MTGHDKEPSRARQVVGMAAVHAIRTAGAAVINFVGWPAIIGIGAIVLCFLILVVFVLVITASRVSQERQALNYQCESRLGFSVAQTASLLLPPPAPVTGTATEIAPSPTQSATALQPATASLSVLPTTTTPTTSATSTSPLPSANTYATLSIPPGLNEREQACAEAVKKGPLVGPPITTPSTSLGAEAAAIAYTQVGLKATAADGTLDGPTNDAFSAANLVRYAYFRASQATVLLPPQISEQITVGDRVDPKNVGPGDLVFYNFSATNGPTAVMIATSATQGVDANTVNTAIGTSYLPTGNVIVKRPALQNPAAPTGTHP